MASSRDYPAANVEQLLPGAPPPLMEGLVRWGLRRAMATVFSEVYADLDGLRAAAGRPVVVVSNHASVFDGLIAAVACDALGRRMWLGVHGSVLARRAWSRRLGYFAIAPGNRARTDRQIAAVAELLSASRDGVVWMYPQGCIVPPGRSVPVRDGAARLARLVPDAMIVGCAARYELFEATRQYAWLKTTAAVAAEESPAVERLLAAAADVLQRDLADGTGRYGPVARKAQHMMLVDNVPIDLRRVAAALEVDVAAARRLCGGDRRALVAHAGVLGQRCGSLYADVLTGAGLEAP